MDSVPFYIKIGAILGMLDAGFGTGAAIGPVIGGFFFDVSSSYLTVFLLGSVVMLIAAFLVVLIRRETDRPLNIKKEARNGR